MPDEQNKLKTITSAQLISLIESSKAVREMSPDKKAKLLDTAKNPDSPEARKIFEALTEEQVMYERINTNYSKIVKEAVDEYAVGITEVKRNMKKSIKPGGGAKA